MKTIKMSNGDTLVVQHIEAWTEIRQAEANYFIQRVYMNSGRKLEYGSQQKGDLELNIMTLAHALENEQ